MVCVKKDKISVIPVPLKEDNEALATHRSSSCLVGSHGVDGGKTSPISEGNYANIPI